MKKLLGFTLVSMFAFVLATSADENSFPQKVSFYTNDGVKIVGLYQPSSKSDGEVFVLLHGLGSNKEEWSYFESKLKEAGFGFLAYDARGHGESISKKNGTQLNYESFGKPSPGSNWSKMVDDLAKTVNFMITQKKLKRKQIGLIGASIGANVSLIYGSSYNHVGTLVLLSPGLSYQGLETLDYIRAYKKGKIAIAASPGDTYAFKSSEILYKKIKHNAQAKFIEGESGHGVQMFDGEFDKQLIDWLSK